MGGGLPWPSSAALAAVRSGAALPATSLIAQTAHLSRFSRSPSFSHLRLSANPTLNPAKSPKPLQGLNSVQTPLDPKPPKPLEALNPPLPP